MIRQVPTTARLLQYTAEAFSKKTKDIVNLRERYLAPSLRTFQAYDIPLALERGEMQYIWDTHGRKHIDLLGQNLCISAGHCHPRIVSVAIEQMKKLPHCTTMYYHEQPAKLAKEIVEKVPPHPSGEDWVLHPVNSGSEAVDLAIQMARVHTGRSETISLHKAYHGLHGYAAAATAIGKATQPCYSGMFNSMSYLPSNRLDVLESHLKYATGGNIACMIAEPLQGYGGIIPLQDGYLRDAFELVRKYGGLTIADEVQTGYGRCGENFWGFQMKNNDCIPDIITIAKGMGNGIGIIGGVIARRSVAESFTSKMFFNTYGSNPVACAVAREVLKVIDEEKLVENCYKMGNIFRHRINKLCEAYPQVLKEIRGSGLFQGLEINGKNEEDSMKHAYEMHKRLLDYGVVIGRGSAAGNVFRIQPPMCIEEKDVNYVVESIEEVAQIYIQENYL